MTLNQGASLKMRKVLSFFVSLARPHATHTFGASLSETVDDPEVVFEMAIEGEPVSINRSCHQGNLPVPPTRFGGLFYKTQSSTLLG